MKYLRLLILALLSVIAPASRTALAGETIAAGETPAGVIYTSSSTPFEVTEVDGLSGAYKLVLTCITESDADYCLYSFDAANLTDGVSTVSTADAFWFPANAMVDIDMGPARFASEIPASIFIAVPVASKKVQVQIMGASEP